MQTTAIYISTLCIPCENRCRYCLLSWDGKTLGADYDRSQKYAEGFYHWMRKNRPELSFQFYYGYAMEHPRIEAAIDFARRTGSAGGEFLQLDGLKFRQPEALRQWLARIQSHGIQAIDLTFYGTKAYHDRFAGRKGDYDYMLEILRQANALDIQVHISIPITSENAGQMEELLDVFHGYRLQSLRIFIPHREGRGASLEKIRLSESELQRLSPRVRSHIHTARYKSEGQWIREGIFQPPQKRVLGLCLTPENIGALEEMPYPEVISRLEQLDDQYYQAIPTLETLAQRYGDSQSEKLFDMRDLYLYYQIRYIRENQLSLYDMNDERHCFSRRY